MTEGEGRGFDPRVRNGISGARAANTGKSRTIVNIEKAAKVRTSESSVIPVESY
jgi:hypothetical protein